jgi:hypothetical protein
VAVSVYYYVASVHDYGQVVVARESVSDVIESGDVCGRGAYDSVGHDVDGTGSRFGFGGLNIKRENGHAD